MPLIIGAKSATATYTVDNSCRFNFGDSPKLTRAVSTGTANTKFTLSCWFKTSTVNSSYGRILWGGVDSGNETGITLYATSAAQSGAINLYLYGSSSARSWVTNTSHRDPSAWYHMVVRVDTTDATAGDRIQLWVNGTRVTSWNTSSNPDENETFDFFHSNNITIGREQDSGDRFSYDGYLAEVCAIDGTAYTASDFGEFSSDSPTIWVPKDPSGLTFGTSGFYLDFEDSADLGADVSGNSNDFTEGSLDATDQATDTPTNNFATFNPITRNPSDTGSLSQGNCKYSLSSYAYNVKSTIGVSKGKWYFEVKTLVAENTRVGWCSSGFNNNLDTDDTSAFYPDAGGGVWITLSDNDTGWQITNNDTSANTSQFTNALAASDGSILMCAFDCDSGKIWFGVDGSWFNSGDPAAGSNETFTASNSSGDPYHVYGGYGSSGAMASEWNFGGCASFTVSSGNADGDGYGNFEHAPPSGYYALCTKNLAEYG